MTVWSPAAACVAYVHLAAKRTARGQSVGHLPGEQVEQWPGPAVALGGDGRADPYLADVDDLGYEQELRDERDRLFDAFEAVCDPASLLDFQLGLVAEITAREPDAFAGRSRAAREHLRLLRLLGDGLAWRYLDAYAIRQLAKNPAAPPGLTGQRGFELTLQTARQIADHGHPALVADLTHCLTIGDVIVCTVPAVPFIIECGGNPRFAHKGRKARQRQRAQAVSQLLVEGETTFPNHSRPTLSLAISTPAEHSWDVLERVILAAADQGMASECAADGDLIFALRGEEDIELFELPECDAMTSPTVATYTRSWSALTLVSRHASRGPSQNKPAAWCIRGTCSSATSLTSHASSVGEAATPRSSRSWGRTAPLGVSA